MLGIDLGTTNTAAVAYGPESPGPVSILHGRDQPVMPSVVSMKNARLPIVGWLAKDMLLTDPLTTIYGWKRFLGRSPDSEFVARHRARFPFRIQGDERGQLGAVVGHQVVPFVDIAAMVLDQVRLQTSAMLSRSVRDAVIAVPAHFNHAQRRAVTEAATRAGLNVMSLINEPTAAALAFGLDQKLQSRLLVFDLGGGTFDATILELTENVFDVKATRGEGFLGGIDFDRAIMNRLIEYCRQTHLIDPSEEPIVAQRLLNAAESAKRMLSVHECVDIRVPMIGMDRRGDSVDLEYRLDRRELEQLTAPLVERAIGTVEEMMRDAGFERQHLQQVIISGGQSRMPLVLRRIEQALGQAPWTHLDADTCVALGAAVFARSHEHLDGAVLLDVLSVPIGAVLPGGQTQLVFPANTSLPAQRAIAFDGRTDDRGMSIGLFQGADIAAPDRQMLGILRVPSHVLPRGERFLIELDLSEGLHLRARFRSSTQTVPLVLEGAGAA